MGKLKRDFLDRLILSFLLERGVKFLERPARITENLKRRDKKKRNSQKNLYNASDMTKKKLRKTYTYLSTCATDSWPARVSSLHLFRVNQENPITHSKSFSKLKVHGKADGCME